MPIDHVTTDLDLLPAAVAKKIDITDGGHWVWTGATTAVNAYGTRYGRIGTEYAQRVVWSAIRSDRPPKMLRQICPVPLCVRADHWFSPRTFWAEPERKPRARISDVTFLRRLTAKLQERIDRHEAAG